MRYLVLATVILVIFVSCNKDKYTTAPQIKFKSITASYNANNSAQAIGPIVTIEVTDKEGDFGFEEGKDTSYVFIKNLTVPPFKMDSFRFPASLAAAAGKDFKADLDIALKGDGFNGGGVLDRTCTAGCTDTLYFEVYVKDLMKNKSNVIKTDKPLLYVSP